MRNSLVGLKLLAGMSLGAASIVEEDKTAREPFVPRPGRNSRCLPIRVKQAFFLNNQKDAIATLDRGDLHEINKHPVIKEYLKYQTIVHVHGRTDKENRIVYSLVLLEIPYPKLLNKVKGFAFKGDKTTVVCKRLIMGLYLESHKYFKDTVVTLPEMGEGVTRANFTKSLIDFSGDVNALLKAVVKERFVDTDTDLRFWD